MRRHGILPPDVGEGNIAMCGSVVGRPSVSMPRATPEFWRSEFQEDVANALCDKPERLDESTTPPLSQEPSTFSGSTMSRNGGVFWRFDLRHTK